MKIISYNSCRFGFLILLVPAFLSANMRAPVYYNYGAHQALRKIPQAVVTGETLNIKCELEDDPEKIYSSRCIVGATYRINSPEKRNASLKFLFPHPQSRGTERYYKDSVKNILVNGKITPYQIQNPDFHRRDKMYYTVLFKAELVPNTTIEVHYEQPLSVFEIGSPSYFRDPKIAHFFEYVFFPLREWQLAENFHLDVNMSINKNNPGFLFWRKRIMNCQACSFPFQNNCNSISTENKLEKGNIIFQHVFGKKFPDMLHCEIGRADLLE